MVILRLRSRGFSAASFTSCSTRNVQTLGVGVSWLVSSQTVAIFMVMVLLLSLVAATKAKKKVNTKKNVMKIKQSCVLRH